MVVVVRTCSLYDMSVHTIQQHAPNKGARSPVSKLPVTPAPLPHPNGGGQPWPCACAQGPTKRHASCKSTQPAHRDVDHLVNELQLGKCHGPQHSLDHGTPPLHHEKDNELHDLCSRDIEHPVEQLGEFTVVRQTVWTR